MAAPLPLAAGEWLEALLPLLFLLFWVVSQIRNLFRAANPGRPQAPVVVRPQPRVPAADEAHRELVRQVDEFLRRSAGGPGDEPGAAPRRATAGGRGVAGTSRAPAVPPPLPVQRPSPQTGRESRGRRAPSAAPSAPEPTGPLGSLGGHGGDVARHVGDAFAHEIRHLESGVGRSDPVTSGPAAATAGACQGIAALLRDPSTLRQLVLVREILERPVQRW